MLTEELQDRVREWTVSWPLFNCGGKEEGCEAPAVEQCLSFLTFELPMLMASAGEKLRKFEVRDL